MRYSGRGGPLLLVVVLAAMPTLLGSCGSVECSQVVAEPRTTFVGTVTAITDSTAEIDGTADFTVESVQVEPGARPEPHKPAVGAAITVAYPDDGQNFLHVGDRYRVFVNWSEGKYESDVHTAEDCGGASGTTHADGSAIDTARVSWFRVHRALIALALAPVVALVILSAWIWRKRRRAELVDVDERYL